MIEVKKVKISFNKKDILKNISFLLEPGKCYGLFGNNGVGKTTLTKIIFGELKPDSGIITYNSKDFNEINYKEWYFFVENNELPSNIKVITYINLAANMYNIDKNKIKDHINKFKKIINIEEIKNTLIKKISAGQKKLLSMFILFLVKPKVIFLDEPTANLDIKNKEIILNLIKEFIDPSTIIVIITHLIDEVSSLVNHIILLDEGIIKYNKHFDSNKEDINFIFKNNTINSIDLIKDIVGEYKNE